MRTYDPPRRGHCFSCEGAITGRPVYQLDEAYCCTGCARGGPCVCSYEADRAEDGVDGIGMPFAVGRAPAETMVDADVEAETAVSR